MDARTNSILKHVAILALLLSVLVFVLVHFHIVSCNFFTPIGCDIYYSLIGTGKPKILIVSGSQGLGNPDYLYEVLRSPNIRGNVGIRELEVVSLPLLRENQLVIVERARQMCTEDLEMFMEYVNTGGKLVWIGDAGTEGCGFDREAGGYSTSDFLSEQERYGGESVELIGPWARKSGDNQVSFDTVLGVNYKANYCELADCGLFERTGTFEFVDQDKQLVYGLGQDLPFFGDFAIVAISKEGYQTSLAYMDNEFDLVAEPKVPHPWLSEERQNFGRDFPVIVSSGVGGRVAYYAFPPEFFVSNAMPIDERTGQRIAYWALMENLYYGMLYK